MEAKNYWWPLAKFVRGTSSQQGTSLPCSKKITKRCPPKDWLHTLKLKIPHQMIPFKGCALYFDAQSRSPKVMDAHLTLMPTISWPPVAVAVVAGMVVADRKS